MLSFCLKKMSALQNSFILTIKLVFCFSGVSFAQTNDGVVVRCGASAGHGYYFHDAFMNPDGPSWIEDGIASGKIILVRLGDEWDIQFDDAVGAAGYRNDGAQVIPLMKTESKITIGAFNELYAIFILSILLEKKSLGLQINMA